MRARILSEQMIKMRFPHLRYVRIHSEGRHKVTVYAWNEDLQLPDHDIRNLKQYASEYLNPYVCFKIKPYHLVQDDEVPQLPELPDELQKKVLSRGLDQDEIMDTMNEMIPFGQLDYVDYDAETGTLHFEFLTERPIDSREQELVGSYLSEMIPIGTLCAIEYQIRGDESKPGD